MKINNSRNATILNCNKKLNELGYKRTFPNNEEFMGYLSIDLPWIIEIFRSEDFLIYGTFTSALTTNESDNVNYLKYNFVDVYKLPISSIEYYATNTSVSYINKVYNEGKNISLSGAIIGGMVAGDAGAIIGAGKNQNQLVNQTERKIDFEGCIVINKDGKITKYNIYQNLADKLEKLCPEKNLEYIQAHQNVLPANSSSSKEKLKDLKELFDEGLISEEDYNNKKNEILNNI